MEKANGFKTKVSKSMAVAFYGDLYSEDNLHQPLYVHRGLFPSISSLHAEEIRKQYTAEDVRVDLFEMKPKKEPGVDGIQTVFLSKALGNCRW